MYPEIFVFFFNGGLNPSLLFSLKLRINFTLIENIFKVNWGNELVRVNILCVCLKGCLFVCGDPGSRFHLGPVSSDPPGASMLTFWADRSNQAFEGFPSFPQIPKQIVNLQWRSPLWHQIKVIKLNTDECVAFVSADAASRKKKSLWATMQFLGDWLQSGWIITRQKMSCTNYHFFVAFCKRLQSIWRAMWSS